MQIIEVNVNPYCVGTEFLRLVKETLDYEEKMEPSLADSMVAKLLFKKFSQITLNFVFMDELENTFDSEEPENNDNDLIDDDGNIIQCETVPLETKTKILQDKHNHPNWSFETLKNRHSQLKHRKDLSR